MRVAFIIDAFDREIIAFTAVAGVGISGSDMRDMMLDAVETRFGTTRAPPDRAPLRQRQPGVAYEMPAETKQSTQLA